MIGIFLLILGVIMLGTASVCYAIDDPYLTSFLFSSFITIFSAGILILAFRTEFLELATRQAFLLTFLTWTTLSLFAAIPLLLSFDGISFVDAYFETVSALTTTGASIFPNVDMQGISIHLWRAFLAGFGGIGVIVLAIAVLPILKIGGMQLLMTESSEKSEKFLPRTTQIATTISLIYLALISICAFVYWIMGMPGFEAIFYAITTLSTSGFSIHNSSFAFFEQPAIQWTASFFMLMGALPFILYLKFLKGKRRALFFDSEVRTFINLVLISIILLTCYLYAYNEEPFIDLIRKATFHVVAYASTTGFVTEDITRWDTVPMVIILFMIMLGGCSGSTAGGLKIFRFRVLLAQTSVQFLQLIHHRGVFVPQYNRKPISSQISSAVGNYIFVYLGITFLIMLGLGYYGMSTFDGLSTAIGCLSNCAGVSETSQLGPMGSYANIPDGAKCIMIGGMLLGRLEIFSVLIIFLPLFWRD